MQSCPTPSKARSRSRAFLLVETSLSLSILTLLGLLLLKLSLNIIQPRQWAIHQSISDAYLTCERAAAERISYSDLTAVTSPWPTFPAVATRTEEIGRLPGGHPISATIHRFRIADSGNVPSAEGTARTTALVNNPAEINSWKVQSILVYRIANRTYSKSRTVIRSQ